MTKSEKGGHVMSKKTEVIINVALIGALLLVLFLLENALPSTHMLFTVLKKGAIYALVAVSMNLLNGFTGLFSLGQAGFMLVGAYTYGVLTIPVAERAISHHWLILHGRYTCVARKPKCGDCPLSAWCRFYSVSKEASV